MKLTFYRIGDILWWNYRTVQKYLTATYIRRSEEDMNEGMVNLAEAFLLTALYING